MPEYSPRPQVWDVVTLCATACMMGASTAFPQLGYHVGLLLFWIGLAGTLGYPAWRWGQHYLYLRPQVVHAAALKPVHEIVAYVAGRIGDTNTAKCWPDARRAIRQAALDGNIRIYGCKSEDTGNSQATSWSLVRTLIPPDYWELADLTGIATAEHWEEQLTPHTFPHRLSDGRFTNEKITYYTKLQAKWDEVKKAWP